MPITPFKDRFGKALALTGSVFGSSLPSVGVSSSFDLINTAVGGMDTSAIDRFRQGVSVSSKRYTRRNSPATVSSTQGTAVIGALPILTSNGLDKRKFRDVHGIETRDFGQPKLFVDDEPYEDIATMRINTKISSDVTSAYGGAIAFLEDVGQQQYPVILANVSMKYPDQMDGVIEPLAIREVISNRSAETPFVAHRIRADILDGNIEEIYGSDAITQIMSLTGSQEVDPFIDAAEIAMSDGSTFTLFAPGYTSDIKRLLSPFLDSSVKFYKILVGTGSIRDLGLVDRRHKSAGGGFTYNNNAEGTDSLAFGGFARTGSITQLKHRTRFLSEPPRIELRRLDSTTGSYPTINRTGDRSRLGKYNVNFDDRKTVIFATASAVYPQVLNIDSPNFIFATGTLGVVTRSLRKGVSDIRVEFTPGERLGPFDDSLIALGTTDFYLTGTSTDVMDGFSGPLKSKTQIFFDISPKENTILTRAPNGRYKALVSDPGPTKTGFVYWNSSLHHWEQVGISDPATGADIKPQFDYAIESNSSFAFQMTSGTNSYPQQFVPCQNAKFTAAQVAASGSVSEMVKSRLYHFIGSPTITSFAPFKTIYHATSSQTITMSDYISHPFLLEKVVVRLKGKAQRIHPRGKEGAAIRHQDDYVFFIYRQERRNTSGSFRGGSPNTPTISKSFRVDSAFDVSGSQRFLVCSGVMSFYNSTCYTSDAAPTSYTYAPVNTPAFLHDFNITSTSNQQVGQFTGSMNLQLQPAVASSGFKGSSIMFNGASPNASDSSKWRSVYHYWPGGTTTRPFLNGGPRDTSDYDSTYPSVYTGKAGVECKYGNFTFDKYRKSSPAIPDAESASRQLPIVEVDPRTMRPLGPKKDSRIDYGDLSNASNRVAFSYNSSQSAVSPYLLFPEDEIVFGIEAAIAPGNISELTGSGNSGGGFGGQNSLTGSKLEIFQSLERQTVIFYGSLIKDGKEYHDTLNQPLTSDAIHEAILEPIVDQWDISTEFANAGTYSDNYVTGTMVSSPYPHNVVTDEFSSNANSTVRGIAGSFIMGTAPNKAGSFQRSVTLFDSSQRFYDTIMPDLKTYARRIDGFQQLQATGSQSTIVLEPPSFYIEYGGNRMPFPYEGNPERKINDDTNLQIFGKVSSGPSVYGSSYLKGSGQQSSIRRILFMIGFDGGTFETYFGKFSSTTINTSGHAHPQSTGSKGFRYGIQNIFSENPRAMFRRDRYGQFRDMLEQRQGGRFFEPFLSDSEIMSLGSKNRSSVSDPAVFCRFTLSSSNEEVDPYHTSCSNLSFAATSSLPYFDGDIVNVSDPTLLTTVALVRGTTLPTSVRVAIQTPSTTLGKF